MNEQEIRDAIEWLEQELESIMHYASIQTLPPGQSKARDSYRTALAALRAQIEPGFKPKKLRHVRQFIYGDCSCGREVKTCEAYCCSCGQKLDWILDDRGAEELRNQKWDGEQT